MKELPIELFAGDIIEIDGIEYVFERVDPDGRITFVSLGHRVAYEVTDKRTGFPIKPNADDVAALMITGKFVKRAKDLQEGARRVARKMELDAAAARQMDPKADFRVAFLRAYDADPCGLSDRAMRMFSQQLLTNDEIASLPGARVYAGSTLREWIHDRGHRGDRRTRDGVSMTGKIRPTIRVNHPKEILEHWLATPAVGKPLLDRRRRTTFSGPT